MSRRTAFVLAGALLALGLIVVVARMTLPQSACVVSEAKYRTLPMHVSYDSARAHFGCDGVRVAHAAQGPDPASETYAWRADAWAYGRVDTEFVKGMLRSKSFRALSGLGWKDERVLHEVSRR